MAEATKLKRAGQDLVALTPAERPDPEVQRGRAAGDGDGVLDPEPGGEVALEALDHRAQREAARAQHLEHQVLLARADLRPGERDRCRLFRAPSLIGLEGVLQRVDEGLPGGLDDVLRDADRPPLPLAVGGVEQDAGDGAGAVALVEDPDLVVGQLDVGEVRVAVDDRAAQGPVEGVDRAVALGDARGSARRRP